MEACAWPRDHFWRSTMAPDLSWPTTWKVFLPMSIPATAMRDELCSWAWALLLLMQPPVQRHPLVGREHGRTISLGDLTCAPPLRCSKRMRCALRTGSLAASPLLQRGVRMRRREFIALVCGAAIANSPTANAQQSM